MTDMNKETLSIDVKFRLKDVLRYNMSVALKSIANRVVLLAGLGIIIYFFYKMANRTVTLDLFISQNIIYLIIPILIFVMIPWRVWQVTVAQMQTTTFSEGVTYIFSNEKIVLDIGEAQEEASWGAFVNVVETKHDFRFFINAVSAQIIPKHNLDEASLQTLRALIKSSAARYQVK